MNKQEFLAFSLPYKLAISVISPFNSERRFEEWLTAMNYDQHYQTVTSKPILHPLSDLTKEIKHNGEMFVPIEKIWSIVYNDSINSKFEYITTANSILCHSIKTGYDCHVFVDNIYDNKFWKIIKLVEWHFDIAGLIEKGEAIDVNTLPENPYK